MGELMKKWIIVVILIILIPVLVLGYLGFVPGLSDLMGSNKPRDLGVRYTQADLNSLMAKNGVQDVVLPPTSNPAGSLRYEGTKPLKNSFTQEELTARMADNEKVKYNPLSEPQLRINADGTAEMSGKIDLDMIEDSATAFNVPDYTVQEAVPYIDKVKAINPNPAFYGKGKIVIKDNQISLDMQKAEIGRTPIPLDQLPMDRITSGMEDMMGLVPGLNVKSLTFEDGKMSFDGNVPAKVSSAIKE
jgi:hypothetical protein